MSEKPIALKRLYALDVLRGLAAMLVLIRHVPDPYSNLPYSEITNWSTQLMVQLRQMGWIGVDLFFVLSGFLISGLLYREVDETGGLKVKRFLLRRGFKIWPSYFVAYGGMTLLLIARAAMGKNWTEVNFQLNKIFYNSIFIQNYVVLKWQWAHSWSIAVEEHFYLVLPIVFLIVLALFKNSNQKLRAVPWFCIAMIVLCPVMRIVTLINTSDPNWNWSTTEYNWHALYYPSHLRADSLCFGVLIGYLFRYHRDWATRIASAKWIGIPLVLLSFATPLIWHSQQHWFSCTIGFSLIALGFSWLVLASGIFPDTGNPDATPGATNGGWKIVSLPCSWLAWIGIYSYTIYLAHSVIFGIPGMDWSRRKLIAIAGQFVDDSILVWIDYSYFWFLSILLGVLLSKLIEQPLLKIRSKFVPSHYVKK